MPFLRRIRQYRRRLRLYTINQDVVKFRHIFLIASLLIGLFLFIFLIMFNVNIFFLLIYLLFVWTTFILIVQISEVNESEHLDKFEFSKFIITYLFIVLMYIILFSWLFFLAFIFRYGYFKMDNVVYLLNPLDAMFISGITFVSYDVGFYPEGYMRLLVFIEIFVSQVIVLSFVIIGFGKLLDKIRGRF